MKIAVLTSGGHAPGMNAAVRAVSQSAFVRDWEVVQAVFGYVGLMEGVLEPVERDKLEGFMQLGGTVLGTERSDEFRRKRVSNARSTVWKRPVLKGWWWSGAAGASLEPTTCTSSG